ncbi:MAG TPA: HD domain-containing protein [Clostridiales bacterium]|nr:HD domain-containing protein [Clostridiales bacterium]
MEKFDVALYNRNRVRDSVHGFIHFSDVEKEIINLPEFQRLRNIKQLAFTYYVYPGAMHSRFEHSLGVMELATRAVLYLLRDNHDYIAESLQKIGRSIQQAVDCLRLAALLHDIGHLPFSHGAESVLPTGKKHEDVSIAIIQSLRDKLDKWYFSGVTELVIQLIHSDPVIPELCFMKNILSGQIDVDRIDYLLRDSLHCGVKYGTFDYTRLLETLVIMDSETTGVSLAIDSGGVQALESLILARYYMYTQVLCHRTRRIYDIYLQKYLEEQKKNFKNLVDVIGIDDFDLMIEIKNIASTSEMGNKWAKYITNRDHHSVVYETGVFAGVNDRRLAEHIYNKLREEFSEQDVIIDFDAKGTIHKFVVPDRDEDGDFFYVRTRQGQYKLITEMSKIIRDMPQRFCVIRIYAKDSSPKKESNIITKMKEIAAKLEKEGLL